MYAKRALVSVLALIVSTLLIAPALMAQVETGSITGTVRDPSGARIPNATVVVRNVATGAQRTVQAGNFGQYTIGGLVVGTYEITVSSPNFANYKTNAEVTVGGVATVDVAMSTGQATTTVEVVAGAGGSEVNTQTQELSQLVDTQQLAELPSLTRNPYDFVAIGGNVSNGDSTTPNTSGGQNQTGRGTGFALNGQRESGTEILLDGVENVDLFVAGIGEQIPIDGVQEYRVITNNFDTLYGRASGGVVNLTTKSGTNRLHGSAWDFNRLSTYTANTFANDSANALFRLQGGTGPLPDPKGHYTRNQFGFYFGGPIIKDKLFFFESTEWTRVRSNPTQTQEVLDPTFISMLPSNVQSYFAAFGGRSGPPPTRVITAGALGTAGLTIPAINGTRPVAPTTPVFDVINFKTNFDAGGDFPQNTYRVVGRIDFNPTEKTQMFFRYGHEDLNEFAGSATPAGYSAYPQYDVGQATLNDSGLYSLIHTFSPNFLSSSKVSFSRLNVLRETYNTALQNTPSLMLTGFATDPATGLLIQLPGLENVAPGLGGLPFGGPQNTLQLEEDLALTKGNHSPHFGGQFTYIQLNKSYGAYAQAVEQLGSTLQGGINNLVNSDGNPAGSSLVSYAFRANPNGALPCVATPQFWSTNASTDLIQTPGCTVTPPLGPAQYGRSYRYKDWAIYAQDSFRITPRLTINYGVRYEHYGVQHNNNQNLDSNFYLGAGSGLYQQVRSGAVFGTTHSPVGQFWDPDWGTVAPRVGFALDVFGDGRTSVRGGFGISYERNFGNVTFNASFNPPASAVVNSICAPGQVPCAVVATNSDTGILGRPGPSTQLPPVELRMPDPHINTAQTQFWSFDAQHQVARNTVLDVGYSGAHGVHLYDIENINLLGSGNLYLGDNTSSPSCIATGTNPTLCYTRANSQYSNINRRGSLGGSFYSALNVRFQSQNLHNTGFTVVANYTYAHSLDDISSTFSDSLQGGSGAIGSLGYTNVLNPKLDWGSSDYDIRHRFVASPVWQTPWYKSGTGLGTQVLGGWALSGVFTIRTGIPFSVFDYTDNLNLYTVPRLTPLTPITQYQTGTPQPILDRANLYNILSVPVPAVTGALNPVLGISDFGPYPADMSRRNSFRGPGAWNTDLAVDKNFKLTERVGLLFRAESFDVFNHHNYYVNTSNLDYGFPAPGFPAQGPGAVLSTGSNSVTAEKGGLGSVALGGNHDERRFMQFSLRVSF
jgi:hypothetical protein